MNKFKKLLDWCEQPINDENANYWGIRILTIILALALVLSVTSCTAQTSNTDSIPVMEYYDFDNIPNGGILMYPDGVIDFIYCTQDEEYIIEYMDADAFDPDNLPISTSCASINADEPVVQIYCSEELFFEYLNWYNSLTNKDSAFFEPSDKYFIKLAHVGNPTEGYDYYKLITN